jgi:hypothetical protein
VIGAWLRAFLFTQLVEVPIYMRGAGCSLPVAFGASLLTHPVVWFVFFSPRWNAGYTTRTVAAELFACLAEAAYLRFLAKRPRALLWSLGANAASLGLGLLSRSLFGVP